MKSDIIKIQEFINQYQKDIVQAQEINKQIEEKETKINDYNNAMNVLLTNKNELEVTNQALFDKVAHNKNVLKELYNLGLIYDEQEQSKEHEVIIEQEGE